MRHPERRAREVLKRLPEIGPLYGAEVGVWRGEMSQHLLKRSGVQLIMVDPWRDPGTQPPNKDGASQDQLHAEAERRTAFAAKRRNIMRLESTLAASLVRRRSLDFVFIDGDHSYAAVVSDIASWLPCLKPGALLSGHDYSKPGERSATGWPGVVRAVDEFCEANGLEMERGAEYTWFVRLPA